MTAFDPSSSLSVQAWRAGLLWFPDPDLPQPRHEQDGMLITRRDADGVVRIADVGAFAEVAERWPGVPVTHWPHLCIAPGFVDLHVHYPQTDVIASPAEGLLPWLEHYTFPHEKQFADPAHALETADFFLDELLRNGVTTALCFATAHPQSVDAFMQAAQARQLRMVAGKVLQDRHSPDGLRDADTRLSLRQTEDLIRRWHGVERLGYAITPRFAPTSSPEQLHGAGEIAAQFPDVWIQSHLAENLDEIRWVHELFPQARSYLDVYDRAGLLRERAVYAHCIHLEDADRRRMAETGSVAAVSPTSNLFLGSGFFDYAAADRTGLRYGLASDVGGGTSFSPLHTMHAAYTVARQNVGHPGLSLAPGHLWWQHTAGGAQALGLGGTVGNLLPGCEADFIALDPRATPLLARRTAQAETLAEWLFALIVLGDDRLIGHTVVQGQSNLAQNARPQNATIGA
ncbi:MAG: guanine deaminase [Limnohabitans sp.]|nr:MAG: guanine deaminase [Limnohabitans sp.]